MGIKDLTDIIKKRFPECIKRVPITNFSNKKICVDGNHLFVKYWSSSCSNITSTIVIGEEPDRNQILSLTIVNLFKFIIRMLYSKITLVFVFDGGVLKEKSNTIDQRRKASEKTKENLKKIKDEINDDPFSVTEKQESDFKKYQRAAIKSSIKDKIIFQELLESLGIPVLISLNDGEKLCVSLCIEKKVDAVLSNDSDLLALGCYQMLTGIVNNDDGERCFEHISLTNLLEQLEFTMSQFVDFCIMLGCDYNTRIPKKGPVASFNLINEYKSIENIPDIDSTCLNYETCRTIFSHTPSDDLTLEGSISLEYKRIENYDIAMFTKYHVEKESNIIFSLKRSLDT
jgi:flap endonuclease-1